MELFNLEDLSQVSGGVRHPKRYLRRKVGPNDTLQSIAMEYHVDEAEILKQNNMKSEDVKPGIVLLIPLKSQ